MVAAALLIGSGVGVILGDLVSPINPIISSLPAIAQPIVFSLLVVFAHAISPRGEHWASALALSTASAVTAVTLRIAATALGIMRAPGTAAPQLLTSLSYPQKVSDQSMLVLLSLSFALTLGQMLLAEGFMRQFSPLWIGVETLPTPVTPPSRIELKELVLGGPIGALLAWLDLGVTSPFLGVVPWAFTLLYVLILPVATALTLSMHLLLQLVLADFGVLDAGVLYSVRAGVQLGLVASTATAAVLLHAKGSAALYPKRLASLAVSMLGLLLLLLGYTVIEAAYAVYLLLNTLLLLLLTIFVVIRLEGGALAILQPAYPIVPELLQLAWLYLSFTSEKILEMRNAEQLMGLVLHPSFVLTVVVLTLWDCKLVTNINSAALLPLALGAPIVLLLTRVVLTQMDYTFPSRIAGWDLRVQRFDAVPSGNGILVFVVAVLVAASTFMVYYASSTASRLRYARLILDPSGLMFAYSVGQALPKGYLIWGILTLFVALSMVRFYLVTLRVWSKIKGYLYGASTAYGMASTVLLYLLLK